MTLKEAIHNFEIYKVFEKITNKKGKKIEVEVDRNEVDENEEGRISIRDCKDYTQVLPVERLVFIIDEKKEDFFI